MKKKILLGVLTLFSTFAFFTKANALTKVNFLEVSNGEINTTIHFEEGFVGGLDITFKVNGDVTATDFVFATKIQNGNYTKSFIYDEKEHTINVKVTSGGISQSHNLLNENKELNLGKIIFTTSAQESLTYSLAVNSLIYIDNSWQSDEVLSSHLTLGDKDTFTYQIENKEEPPVVDDNKEPEEDKKDEEINTPNDNPEENNKDNNNSTDSSNSSNDSSKDDNKETEEDKKNEGTNIPDNKSDTVWAEDSESISNIDKFLIGVIIAIVAVVGITISLFIIRKKRVN